MCCLFLEGDVVVMSSVFCKLGFPLYIPLGQCGCSCCFCSVCCVVVVACVSVCYVWCVLLVVMMLRVTLLGCVASWLCCVYELCVAGK